MFGIAHEKILGLLRHLITFVGGWLVARGKIDEPTLESIGGGIITIVGVVFSLLAPEKAKPGEAVPPSPTPAKTV